MRAIGESFADFYLSAFVCKAGSGLRPRAGNEDVLRTGGRGIPNLPRFLDYSIASDFYELVQVG